MFFHPAVLGWLLAVLMMSAVLVFCRIDGKPIFTFIMAISPDDVTVGRRFFFSCGVFALPLIAVILVLSDVGDRMRERREFKRMKKEIEAFFTIVSEVMTHSEHRSGKIVIRVRNPITLERIAREYVAMVSEIHREQFMVMSNEQLALFMHHGVRANLMAGKDFKKLIEVFEERRRLAAGKGFNDVAQLMLRLVYGLRLEIEAPTGSKLSWFETDMGESWLKDLDRLAPTKKTK
jgi:hypothetical protein